MPDLKNQCWLVRRSQSPLLVLNICERDCQMMMKSLDWMVEMDGKQLFDAMLCYDEGLNAVLAQDVLDKVRAAFDFVDVFIYKKPPLNRWPWAANWAFQATANYIMDHIQRAWFWMEADCVPLKPGWLTLWFNEYARCGKPIMGAVVEGRGHCNGTAIYPADFPMISPSAMRAGDVAWDWEMRLDTLRLVYNSRLLQHAWGLSNGQPHPYDGPPIVFNSQQDVDRWVRTDAVLFHRSKFGDLLDLLRERRLTLPAKPPTMINGCGGGARMLQKV